MVWPHNPNMLDAIPVEVAVGLSVPVVSITIKIVREPDQNDGESEPDNVTLARRTYRDEDGRLTISRD